MMRNLNRPAVALVTLLTIHAALLAWAAVVHSPTIDETQWLPGGVAVWETGQLGLVVNHPPLVELVAAIPVLFTDRVTTPQQQTGDRAGGREFIRANGDRSFWFFTLGRCACIPFSLLGATVCFLWAKALYSPRSGVLAAALWCFCPTILGQGQLVAHDVPATSLGLASCYLFWQWLRDSSWRNAMRAGVGLGLALLTKMTMLIQLALWPALWLAWTLWPSGAPGGRRRWISQVAMLLSIIALGVDVLNLGYGFQGSFSKLGSFRFRSQALAGADGARGNRFENTPWVSIPLPLPSAFVNGVDFQQFALEGGLPHQVSYLRGQWSSRGWPYYYLYALAIKVPLGTWLLAALSALVRLRRLDQVGALRDELFLMTTPAVLLTIASTGSAWTDHLRHILPCFPFAFIWISRVANVPWAQHRSLGVVSGTAFAWTVLSTLWLSPHWISYFNELIGGPRYGHYHLLSSNIDFGQDLLYLKRWYDAHPDARPLGFAYWDMNSIDPRIAGIEYHVPPSGPRPGASVNAGAARSLGPQPGWFALNVNFLHGDAWPGRSAFPDLGYYGYFLEMTPVARAGYSIYIYHVTLEEANRVRAKLGLPLLDAPADHELSG